jgi:hypothetical protein
MSKADKYFSQYIRLRDTPGQCPTCGAYITYETSDCCHYIGRGHLASRYDEINCNAGCRRCNRFKSGEIVYYRMWLVDKYGGEKITELEKKSLLQGSGYKTYDLELIARQYKQKIKELQERKNE